MYVIDSNSLVILLLGILDVKHFGKHRRSGIYTEEDFDELSLFIKSTENLLVIPNVWTEVDNLLNNFSGSEKYPYVLSITNMIKQSTEKYMETSIAIQCEAFYDLGVTDSLLLSLAKECDGLITADSALSDYALASGIKVYDMVKISNDRLRKY